MSWNEPVTNWITCDFPVKDLQLIEFYFGRARATLCMKSAGLRAARMDFQWEGNNYYNILSDAGFASLGQYIANSSKPNSSTLFNFLCAHLAWVHGLTCRIRLSIATILRAREGECVILLGMKCSSWTVVNQGTSRRAPCCPGGDTTKISVRMANCMAARKLGLINLGLCYQSSWRKKARELWKPWAPMSYWGRCCYVYLWWPPTTCTSWSNRSSHCCVGMEGFGTFKVSAEFLDYSWLDADILECDKTCSLVWLSSKEQHLKNCILLNEVFQAAWWMYHYWASSPKRHVIYSNSRHVAKLNLGPLQGWRAAMNKGKKPCRTYQGKDGKKRFHGTRYLKRTEKLVSMFEPMGYDIPLNL